MSRFDLHSEPPTGTKFHERYKHALVKENLAAYRPVMPPLLKDRLEINLDVIDRNDLLILLHTLVNDDSLLSVAFESHLLRDNPQLTHDMMKLHYHSNVRLPIYTDPEIMSSICNALYRHLIRNEWCLAVFRLVGIPMSEKHLATVTAAFPAAKSMKILSLEEMPLYPKQVNVLVSALPLLSSLMILNLSSCGLSSKLIAQLCAFIAEDNKLERLILNSNPVGDSGVLELAKSLEQKNKFRALDLQNCGITATGCRALIQMLYSNRSVEVCDIRRNPAIPRDIALDIAKIMLENNKDHSKQTCYRPLRITTTAPISVVDEPISTSAIEKPRGSLPPRDYPSVKLPQKSRQNSSVVNASAVDDSSKNDGVFVSKEFLSRLETSLMKFQVLLDYLEQERNQAGAEDSRTKPGNVPERRQPQRSSLPEKPGPASRDRSSGLESTTSNTGNSNSKSALDAPFSANSESQLSKSGGSKSPRSFSHAMDPTSSANRPEMPSENYSDSFVSTSKEDEDPEPPSKYREILSMGFPSQSSSGQDTIKEQTTTTATTPKKSHTENYEESVQDAEDITITSDNVTDSFGANLASIEGITRQSSYLKIAEEIYKDPHILESTRASAILGDEDDYDDVVVSSKKSSSSSKKTETNLEELEERLKIIKNKYNEIEEPLRRLGAAFGTAKGHLARDSDEEEDDGSRVSDSEPRLKKPLKLDDVSISDSWIADAIGESNERSSNSIPTSYSADLTGSDLEDF
ncbi:uncharacterized protein LOC108865006 [Galendromus occidentalis]|uniref:Uncharacterized protein LOC108865006 n=1 Tax=Galendromus occidentalis TaxID=34638 RepID=A0AAJ7L838_9ACAR|nr:uncharacterized protein LOC108865006 [Galendromus occidentalis]